ncbi:NAD-dependent epimerase/dehydratase family protein [Enterovirga rhinocerotis]|uniref:UDP-glucuronate 4-epimerase n=1 Tax=Enterovirga rhinocerotis TaxID=1339210 RepID=A0A4V3DXX4_9HYPH|nr:NAD-dependent epimerase/dehydratase family protein [Enterovirga rhinocerotis]TDR90399.1 UDP-glucuronate 4-epimerase [Enterovirga rhinocerotis]
MISQAGRDVQQGDVHQDDERPVLVTGAAGFIGYHVCRRLLEAGRTVVGVDNFDPYYDVALKEARATELALRGDARSSFRLERLDLADPAAAAALFEAVRPGLVIHLAAQPGVRHSLVDPGAYARANLTAFLNVLEGCRHHHARHLVYASSSSVYGANGKMPFGTADHVDHPLSLYGATKKSNELMAHAYSSLFGLPTTGLRFFTVYGPWGRPDMAVYSFTRAIAEGRPIDLYNHGRMRRDFTYVDDIVEGLLRIAERVPGPDPAWDPEAPDPASSDAPYRVYNIGSDAPVTLEHLVATIEREVGRKAIVDRLPIQPGDAEATWADIGPLERDTGFRPSTSIDEGIRAFVAWYRSYHGA